MNRTITGFKSKILNFIIILYTCFLCVFIQYVLFFLNKSVYLGCFLMILVAVFFIFMDFLEKEILILNGLFFLICPLFLLLGKFDFSNYIALNIVSLSLLSAAVYLFREKLISIHGGSKKSLKIIKYLLISIGIIFIITTVFVNKKETSEVFLRISNPEEYYKEIDKIELSRCEYINEIRVNIENPKDGAEVSGFFAVEGWTADLSDIEDANIDEIDIFLNGEPWDGGIFLTRVDTKIRREDIAEKYGEKYKDAGYYIEINSKRLENGFHDIYVYVHSNYFGWKYDVTEVFVNN